MNERRGDFVTGIVIGGLMGFVAGILLAPKSGKETRREIKEGAEELLNRAKEEYEQALDRSRSAYEVAIGKIKALDLPGKVDSLEKEIKNLSAEAKEKVHDKTGRFKRALDAGVEAFKEEK